MEMKNSGIGAMGPDAASQSRRRLLKVTAVGAGLAVLPAANVLAAAISGGTAIVPKVAPIVSLGYFASSASKAVANAAVSPTRGTYELRVVGANVLMPFSLAAQYGAAVEHRFWQAWIEQGMLQHSSPIAIRWAANAANSLPINIKLATATLTTEITAQSGVYALAIAPGSQTAPAWSNLGLATQNTNGASMSLVSRSAASRMDFSYVLFAVQRV
jgi:hypothetical protein